MLRTNHHHLTARPAGLLALSIALALLSGCGSSAHPSASSGSKVHITYGGNIGVHGPGHAKFVATGAIAESGTVLINGRQSGGSSTRSSRSPVRKEPFM